LKAEVERADEEAPESVSGDNLVVGCTTTNKGVGTNESSTVSGQGRGESTAENLEGVVVLRAACHDSELRYLSAPLTVHVVIKEVL